MMRCILPNQTIGIIGGGQLGKMLAAAANRMGYLTVVYDPSLHAPAFSIAHQYTIGHFDDYEALSQFVAKCDVVTYEFENINADLVKRLNEQYNNIPQGHFPLWMTQNRMREKEHIVNAGLPVPPIVMVDSLGDEWLGLPEKLGFPFVVKTSEGGYDGKGQAVVRSREDLPNKLFALMDSSVIAEAFVDYDFEASIIGVRGQDGEFVTFPVARNEHINNILHCSIASMDESEDLTERLHTMLKNLMEKYDVVGILAMEVFVKGDEIYVNELAPRPHNSGHYTIEGCTTSQFEQAIRAVCGLPLGCTTLRQTTIMYNLLGQHIEPLMTYLPHLSRNGHVHLYGKKENKFNRKVGHVTFTCDQQTQEFSHAVFTHQEE
ncbi:5-(carboxyamino)imidazole ribonucleotide synthase [Wohlfahrtiimonas chitiniclastica]|uniref:5-(carboxyamino)imidazole ribonucleotide synthase n=1 Tax=Wohlfahrtiimonas chitiniclastica TaxID=400946 RepID=UPI001BD16CFE|nr:5-(carboxyamino)imidazole ribonucleotide synthase [Wohlfahrtiimonas chitiniclastica]MBS7819922.1 5-(carboxyamino)imidazole ribonucleotide synthase [Wohlfahrtiimonas chitiniclastica]MBS7825733.1 5-(carboxyamino)imidazole ribonucleotide synthase [Wohlfahrtiimonas chitiniclastica]